MTRRKKSPVDIQAVIARAVNKHMREKRRKAKVEAFIATPADDARIRDAESKRERKAAKRIADAQSRGEA